MESNTTHVASAIGNQCGTRGTLLLPNRLLQCQERQRKRAHGKSRRPAHLSATQASLRRRCTEVRRISSQTTVHDQHENLVLMGNPRTNKTHLMMALGIKACLLGYKKCSALDKRNWTVNLTVCRTSSNVWICLNGSMIHDHMAHFFIDIHNSGS